MPSSAAASELTQVPRGQRGSGVGGRLSLVVVEDGAVCLVVDQAGHVGSLLVLPEAVAARRA